MAVRLLLHPERDRYAIGEPVRPQLQIENRDARALDIGAGFSFDWERLAFAAPNEIHLLDPEGHDLAAPYRRGADEPPGAPAMYIAPGKDEWLYLPVYAHIDLSRPGEYRMSVALADTGGALYASDEIRFRVEDIPAPRPGAARIALTPRRAAFRADDPIEIEAQFINESDREIVFLTPQEDSFYGWVNPVYRFRVIDHRGRGLPLALRSGTMAQPSYPPDMRFAVAPRQTHTQILSLPDFPDIHSPGDYRVTLTYLVRDQAIGKAGVILDQEMRWPDDVFRGRIESAEVTIAIR